MNNINSMKCNAREHPSKRNVNVEMPWNIKLHYTSCIQYNHLVACQQQYTFVYYNQLHTLLVRTDVVSIKH